MPLFSATTDPELTDWLYGIINGRPNPSGAFLFHVAHAALHADPANYGLLRSTLLALKAKYPEYHDEGSEDREMFRKEPA